MLFISGSMLVSTVIYVNCSCVSNFADNLCVGKIDETPV